VLVDGQLVGRADTKLHRRERRLELRHVHLEPWFAAEAPPPGASWGMVPIERGLAGLADAARSLAAFTGAERIAISRVTPGRLRPALRRALAASPLSPPGPAPALEGPAGA